MKTIDLKKNIVEARIGGLILTACGNNEYDFDASGTLEATEIVVSAEANGKIMQLDMEEGDQLQGGAEVGYIDSTQLFLQKQLVRARLRSVDVRKPDIHKQIAVRDVMIKGLSVTSFLPEIGILSAMAVVLSLLSVKRFNIRL